MYKKSFSSVVIMLLFAASLIANTLPEIELNPGSNEITIKINNRSSLDLSSIQVVVEDKNIPDGFSIFETSDKATKQEEYTTLRLVINVDKNVERGAYKIPFLLKNNANNSWEYTLHTNVVIPIPEKYELSQNYPNPFNATTMLRYSLPNIEKQKTQLVIINLLGKKVKTLVNSEKTAGEYSVIWDGTDEAGNICPTGVYFYRIISGSFLKTNKMLLIK